MALVFRCKRATQKQKGPLKVRGPTEVNFKHGGSQKKFCLLDTRTYPLQSHFKSDGTTIRSTSPDPVSNSVLLELERGRIGVGKG